MCANVPKRTRIVMTLPHDRQQQQRQQPELPLKRKQGSPDGRVEHTHRAPLEAAPSRARMSSEGITSVRARRNPRYRKVAKRCRVTDCPARPWYAKPGAEAPEACKKHRTEGEVNVYAPTCKAEGCRTRPHFGAPGERAKFCSVHKLPDMIDVLNKRCAHQRCTKQPSFAKTEGGRALFCKDHKQDKMVDTKHKACLHPGCNRLPAFSAGPSPLLPTATPTNAVDVSCVCKRRGSPNAKSAVATTKGPGSGSDVIDSKARGPAKFCAAHAPEGAINVMASRCREPGCAVQPSFGWEGAGEPASYCARHRERGMTDVRNSRCRATGCVAQPRFSREVGSKPTHCARHAEPDMRKHGRENVD